MDSKEQSYTGNRKQKGETVKMETQQKQEYKIYRVYRKRISLNVSEIKTNYVKVSVDIRKENGKTIYTFTVQPIE